MNDQTTTGADRSYVADDSELLADEVSLRARKVAGDTGIPIGFLVGAVHALRKRGETNLRRGVVVTEAKRRWIRAIAGPARHFRKTNPELAKKVEREIELVTAGKYREAVTAWDA